MTKFERRVIPEPLNYSSLSDDKDRISCALNCMLCAISIPEITLERLKNSSQSKEYLERGIDLLESDKAVDALPIFTQALICALPDTELQAQAYARRAEAMLILGCFDECLIEIGRALMGKLPDKLKANMFILRAKALLALHNEMNSEVKKAIAKARRWTKETTKTNQKELNNILDSLGPTDICKQKFVTFDNSEAMPEIPDDNPEIMGASSAIELRYTKEYGRHVIATRDIEAGETLLVQRTFATIPGDTFGDKEEKSIFEFCWYCSKLCICIVPCNNCASVVYCNDDCRDKAWKEHHEIECRSVSFIMGTNMDYEHLMALRLTIKAFKEAGSFEALKEQLERLDSIDGNVYYCFVIYYFFNGIIID